MCGILGYIGKRYIEKDFQNGMKAMAHRGPDNQSKTTFKIDEYTLSFGHLRLSIIDLSTEADQPMYDREGRYCIIFNGEIYNFKYLKKEYLSDVQFQTQGDTEVILEMYRKFGKGMLQYLEGMFAFAIYDKVDSQLFIARDQLGIKPLYLCRTNDGLIFSSEIKGVLQFQEVDPSKDQNCIAEFLMNGFLYEPDTGYQNITKLRPGHYSAIDLKSDKLSIVQSQYWTLSHDQTDPKALERDISYAINSHLISDAKKGLFFSGGVDSSLILCIADEELEVLTVRPDDAEVAQSGMENDFSYAQKIAKIRAIDLIQVPLDDNEGSILADIEWIAKNVEEPIADYTFLASYKLSKAASRRGYKVMLSGMGADELFGGYDRYLLVKYASIFSILIWPVKVFGRFWKPLAKKAQRFTSFFAEKGFLMKYSSLIGYFSTAEIKTLLNDTECLNRFQDKLRPDMENSAHLSPLKQAMYLDVKGFLAHNFMVADKSSMMASIEMRVPLATHYLFSKSMNVQESTLINGKSTKIILKKILEKYLPKNLIYRKKTGFNPPLDTKIWNLGNDRITRYIEKSKISEIINLEIVSGILSSHFAKKENNTYKIYNLLFLAAWYKEEEPSIKNT
jgi:asparagine synthase (glutamine-hydrolysing)